MARIALAIEREIEDARSIRDTSASVRERRINLFLASGRSRRILLRTNFKDETATIRAKARPRLLAS